MCHPNADDAFTSLKSQTIAAEPVPTDANLAHEAETAVRQSIVAALSPFKRGILDFAQSQIGPIPLGAVCDDAPDPCLSMPSLLQTERSW